MSSTEVIHCYDLSDCFGETSRDGRPHRYHRPLNPAGNARQNHSVHTIAGSLAQADHLLERLRAVHGCPRYDLPRELLKSFEVEKFAREYLYKGQAQMPNTLEKLAEHYRKLAGEEVAMAKLALTNEARARHYAKAADYWKLADAAQSSARDSSD